MLAQTYERLLYLDADIVIWKSPKELFSNDLGRCALGAVEDFTIATGGYPRQFPSKAKWMESIGIDDGRYFNSGVLLIDVKRWNDIEFQQKLVTFMNSFGSAASMWGQDFLNYVFQGRWQSLSPLANWQYGAVPRRKLAPFAPYVTHFVGERKPWHHDWPFDMAYQKYFLDGQGSDVEYPQRYSTISRALKLKIKKFLTPRKMRRKEEKIIRAQVEHLERLLG